MELPVSIECHSKWGCRDDAGDAMVAIGYLFAATLSQRHLYASPLMTVAAEPPAARPDPLHAWADNR